MAIVACTCAVMLGIAAVTGAPLFMLELIIAINVIAAAVFGTLTIRVSGTRLDYWFTFGLVRSGVPIAEIAAVQPRTIFPLGFGVRIGDNTTAWLTSGRHAIDLTLHNGRHLVLGTPDPDRVTQAIEQARSTIT